MGSGSTASFEGEPINPKRPFDKEAAAILIQEAERPESNTLVPNKITEESKQHPTKSETAGEDRISTKGLIL